MKNTNLNSTGERIILTDVNVTQCLTMCVSLTEFTCLSVVVHKEDPFSCTLLPQNRYSGVEIIKGVTDLEYWEYILSEFIAI